MKRSALFAALLISGCAHAVPPKTQPSFDEMFAHSILLYCNGVQCTDVLDKDPGVNTSEHNGVKGFVVVFPQGMYTDEQIERHGAEIASKYKPVIDSF